MKKAIGLYILLLLAVELSAAVQEVYITCDPADWNYIYENWEEEVYIPCGVEFNGQKWTDCEMRFRGDGSKKFPRKSIKVKFNGEPFANGREKINLNGEYIDSSRIRNYLAAYIYRKSGAPTYEVDHYRVYLNGEYSGLYVGIENMDEQFLEARGLNPNNNLYKAAFDGSCLDRHDDMTKWEKKTNEMGDWQDLKNLIWELDQCPKEKYYDFLHETFDYDNLVNYIAVSMLITNASTYYHNYYLYNNESIGRWQIFAWDMDKSFACYGAYYSYRWNSDIWFYDNPIFVRSLDDPKVFADIEKRMAVLSETIINDDFLTPVLDSLQAELKTSVLQDTLFGFKSDEDWNRQYSKEHKYLQVKYDVLQNMIKKTPAIFECSRPDSIEFGDIEIKWNKSENMSGEGEITYNVYYGPKPGYDVEGSHIIKDYTDTVFVINDLTESGKYYYRIDSYNTSTKQSMMGYNKYNVFRYVADPTKVDCEITTDVVLTKDKSPYLLDCALHIAKSGSLKLEPGVELYISQLDGHNIEGEFIAVGTADNPIKIYSKYDVKSATLTFNDAVPLELEYVNFKNVLLKTYNTDVTINNCNFNQPASNDYEKTSMMDLIIDITGNNNVVRVDNINIEGNPHIEGLIIRGANDIIVQNSKFNNCFDPFELVFARKSAIISNNTFYNSHDDGIDINQSLNVIIENNTVINATDKAISLGGDYDGDNPTMTVRHNILSDATMGIAVKDNLYCIIENNTIADVNTGISVYNNSPEHIYHPSMETINTIFYNTGKIVNYDANGTGSISYSLSNTQAIEGKYNINTDPDFNSPNLFDYSLKASSPCIDKGDPHSDYDLDGTVADIGAIFFDQSGLVKNNIVINEINYNSADDANAGDWVELYNNTNSDVDVSGWIFSDSDDSHKFVLPQGVTMSKKSYLVIFEDKTLFRSEYPNINPAFGESGFGLSGGGELIRVYDASNTLVDMVEYDDVDPWPTEPDGNGATLELINPDLDNALATSWKASVSGNGTPCAINSTTNGTCTENNDSMSITAYPNPCKDMLSLSINGVICDSAANYMLVDYTGKIYQEQNVFLRNDLNINIETAKLSIGIYFIKIQTESGQYLIPFIKE